MNIPSIDIKDIIVAESSLALTFATDLFIGQEPAEPDNCVTIFDTPGFPPQLTYKKGEDYFYPSIQIRVRSQNYTTGWNLINDIKEFLHARSHETINATVYEVMICSIEPALLDWDDNERARFVTTFNLQRHN